MLKNINLTSTKLLKELYLNLSNKLDILYKKTSKKPIILCILENDENSVFYTKLKQKKMNKFGIEVEFLYFSFENLNLIEFKNKINNFLEKYKNSNQYLVSGVFFQLSEDRRKSHLIKKLIPHDLDIDCLNNITLGKIFCKNIDFLTPIIKSITLWLNYYNFSFEKKTVSILSDDKDIDNIIFDFFLQKKATPFFINPNSKNSKILLKRSDLIILNNEKVKFLTKDMIKEKAIIVDLGYNYENNILYGNVDVKSCMEKTTFITPVPKGIGPLIVYSLISNVIEIFSKKI